MIHGKVVDLQALAGVPFRLPDGQVLEIELVIDTGFAGALTLPTLAVNALGLPFLQEMEANLADDASIHVDVHLASIIWHSEEREVAVLAMGQRPLLGTALLDGFHLGADFTHEGEAVIKAL